MGHSNDKPPLDRSHTIRATCEGCSTLWDITGDVCDHRRTVVSIWRHVQRYGHKVTSYNTEHVTYAKSPSQGIMAIKDTQRDYKRPQGVL